MRFVIDNSVIMAWCFEDEKSPYADAVLEMFTRAEALVPALWPLELANVLLVAERRRRLSTASSANFVNLLSSLSISVDQAPSLSTAVDIMSIGRQTGLSSYDAAYVELAMREGISLCTLDRKIRASLKKCNVELLKPFQEAGRF